MSDKTREPIISVLGHVDSGKTTLLDYIRESTVSQREAGGITQHIGATDVPFEVVRKLCGHLLDKLNLKIIIRGLLFIDTPGHAAFINLRKRGGSVADIAILVVNINEGLMPQTIESINILKQYKTPFIVAANKVDMISGWIKDQPLEAQPQRVKDEFYKKFYILVGQISEHGFDSDLYNNITDFTKQVAIVPLSARSGYGIPELLMMLTGLAQQFLSKKLSVEITSPGRGTILEVKEDVGLGTTIDVILYDGIIRKGDPIVVGAIGEPIVTKVKALLRPKSLDEMRDPREKFKNVDEVYAAFGVKISAPSLERALPGAPVYVGGQELVEKVRREIQEVEVSKDAIGVIVKTDTLGSLEAMIKILSDNNIPIRKASIGKVSKQDVTEAISVEQDNRFLGVVLAFNSQVLENARKSAEDNRIRIIEGNIIYRILEDYQEYVKTEREAERLKKLKEVTMPVKFRILPGHTFRQSKPAIAGVEIVAGTLRTGYSIMRDDGRVIGKIRGMQSEGESIEEAKAGEKVAVSMEDVTMGRNLDENDMVYSFIPSEEVAQLSRDDLSDEERKVLKEIQEIKKKR
ncbi:MAG: translation initiation factor IF-2 [Candidatus Altiarchaeota archaeon]